MIIIQFPPICTASIAAAVPRSIAAEVNLICNLSPEQYNTVSVRCGCSLATLILVTVHCATFCVRVPNMWPQFKQKLALVFTQVCQTCKLQEAFKGNTPALRCGERKLNNSTLSFCSSSKFSQCVRVQCMCQTRESAVFTARVAAEYSFIQRF